MGSDPKSSPRIAKSGRDCGQVVGQLRQEAQAVSVETAADRRLGSKNVL
jgi:hypothetical protein